MVWRGVVRCGEVWWGVVGWVWLTRCKRLYLMMALGMSGQLISPFDQQHRRDVYSVMEVRYHHCRDITPI